jgi:hypothetical protein
MKTRAVSAERKGSVLQHGTLVGHSPESTPREGQQAADPPGRRLEADFGHLYVDFPEGRQQVSVLLLTWSHSGYRFAVALPSEQTEAILAGMIQGFEFFGCVSWEVCPPEPSIRSGPRRPRWTNPGWCGSIRTATAFRGVGPSRR